ncbi:MAG: glycosyltransferase family 4 protein [Anaerolineales bacterium]|nr:MAG: glycosyltransferase family 4 protein [Anaerolineales bacterium]
MMRVVVAHNFYRQSGGEDAVFTSESSLLEQYGHEVIRHTVSNQDVDFHSRLKLAGATLWNHSEYKKIKKLLREKRPDIIHVHNTLPLLSPSIYYAAGAEGVPVVQMLHNYRPFCLNGVLYRDGHLCEDCIGRIPLPGVLHKCYRGSYAASAGVLSLNVAYFRLLKTYQKHISVFITSTQFAKNLFIKMGLKEDNIIVKPNLVKVFDSVEKIRVDSEARSGAIFVGRLDSRKGIWTLLSAIERTNIPLTLVGDGDLRMEIEEWLLERPNLKVEITGWLDSVEVAGRIKRSSVLVLPSEFYESFGNVIVEAFSCGIPVVTTNIGAQSELVQHGRTGYLYAYGDVDALAKALQTLLDNPELSLVMGKNARREFEMKYTAERNYRALMDIYSGVIGTKSVFPDGNIV